MADGPVRWGKPVSAPGPGLYIVELAAPLPTPPIELTKVGKWVERVPTLRLDGAPTTSKALLARLVSLWRPDATVLFVGATSGSIGGRVLALYRHQLGDRRPHADGHWLHTLKSHGDLRVWWARTTGSEEAFDLALDAFAKSQSGSLPGRPADAIDLPWANLRRPTGERQASGITGSMLPDEVLVPGPARRVIQLPPGGAEGTSTEVKGTGTVRRGPRAGAAGAPRATAAGSRGTVPRQTAPRATRRAGSAADRPRDAVALTADAITRMQAELEDLTKTKRPEVVARIKSARELGDLKENSEYHAAREEQSFLEGRVRMLEDRLRFAVLIEEPTAADRTGRVGLGSVVRIEHDGDELTYSIVGTTEAKPAAGRISSASPVGAALMGASAGDEVEVRTPRGVSRYRVVSVD